MYFLLVTLNDYGFPMDTLKLTVDETVGIQQDLRMNSIRGQEGTAHDRSLQAGRRHLITIFDGVLLRWIDGQKIREMCHYLYWYMRIHQLELDYFDCRFLDMFRMFQSGVNIDAVYLRGAYWD